MHKFATLVLWMCLTAIAAKAQLLNPPRDIPAAFRQSPKLLVGLDSRRSFVSGRDVKVMGVRVGLDFEKRARVGFGVYTLASEFNRNFIRTDFFGIVDTIQAQLRFNYLTAYFEYVLLTTKHWEVSLPLHIGIGDVSFTKINQDPKSFLLGEVMVLANYKIFPFLGLAAGVGYRQILLGGYAIRDNFDAPSYSFGIKFWAGYLVDKIIKKKKEPVPILP
ncbi:MAG: hypothetical protein KA239_03555 [Bacteroidia bacterium]|jgi:hypothetical protein|nr:hypothetical protein [Bacteroidota bacterium]MBP6641077.1 hypothetical protein [Bacteroidia bacterium]MBP6721372.1 hypothetical protein [Bacteroidia bacterium]